VTIKKLNSAVGRLLLSAIFATGIAIPAMAPAQGTMPVQWRYSSNTFCNQVAYSPDGTLLAVGGSEGVEIYTLNDVHSIFGLKTAAFYLVGMCFSPDGKSLLTAGSSEGQGRLQLWNVSDGKLAATIPTKVSYIAACAFSADGKTIALGGSNLTQGAVELWDVASKSRIGTLNTGASIVDAIAFTPDGKTVADGGQGPHGGVLELWDVAQAKLTASMKSASSIVVSISVSPDGNTLASAGGVPYQGGGALELWDLPSGALIKTLPLAEATALMVAFSADGNTLADIETTFTMGYHLQPYWHSTVTEWSVATGTPIARASEATEYVSCALSLDGQHLTVGAVGSVEFFSTGTLARAGTIGTGAISYGVGFTPPIFSPDSQTVIGGALALTTQGANVWDAVSGKWQATFGPTEFAEGAGPIYAYSPDGKTIASMFNYGNSGKVQFWDPKTLSLLSTLDLNGYDLWSVQYSPDGKRFAVCGEPINVFKNTVQIWDVASGKLVTTITTSATSPIVSMAFSADGAMMATGGQYGGWNGIVEVWNVATGAKISTLPTDVGKVLGVAFAPNGKQLAVAGQHLPQAIENPYGELELWNLLNSKLLANLPVAVGTGSVQTPVFSKDGKILYVGSDLGLQAFSPATHGMLGYFFNDAAFISLSPDGTKLAYSTNNGGLVVSPIPVIHSYEIANVAFKPSSVAGGNTAIGTVTLTDPAPPGGVQVEIDVRRMLSDTISAVTIPAGSRSAMFQVTTSTYDSQNTLLVTASSGPHIKTVQLPVTPPPPTIVSVIPNASAVTGGSSNGIDINLSSNSIGGQIPIDLFSDNPALTVPSFITLFQGRNYASGVVWTSPVNLKTVAHVTATLGSSSKSAMITILPAVLTQVSVSPTSVQGGAASTGTITMSGLTGSKGAIVSLTSSSPAATVPSKVAVAAGSGQATFTVKTTAVSAQTTVTITATAGGISKTTTLTLTPKT